MKMTILYYSETGTTEKMAAVVRDGILSCDARIDVSLMNIKDEQNYDKSFLEESDAVIFGTPCYVANACWQMQKFFDTSLTCDLSGKLAACFATAGCMWGGADQAIMTILQLALTRGMLAYATGMEFGRPYIHLGPIAVHNDPNTELFTLFGKRVAQKALELFGEAPRETRVQSGSAS